MQTGSIVGVALVVSLFASSASADTAACVDAVGKGQGLRDSHKLIEARDQFRKCAAASCPVAIQRDCLSWTDEADKTIPTVVLSAKDTAGNDALDVSVTLDGAPFVSKLDGVSLPVNPGPHTFTFRYHDGTTKERQLLVGEGQKDVSVSVSIAVAHKDTPPPVVETAGPPWHTIGWITGGVGVVGVVVGTVFGISAIGKKSSADCTGNLCSNFGEVSTAKTDATVSTVGLVVGGVLVAGGAALVLFTPSKGAHEGATIRAVPMIGANATGAMLQGSW